MQLTIKGSEVEDIIQEIEEFVVNEAGADLHI